MNEEETPTPHSDISTEDDDNNSSGNEIVGYHPPLVVVVQHPPRPSRLLLHPTNLSTHRFHGAVAFVENKRYSYGN